MPKGTQVKTFSLSGEDIDLFSDWLEELQASYKVERQNRIRVRLLTEDVLLRLRDRFGEKVQFSASFDVAFSRVRLRIEVAGEPFNPLGSEAAETGDWVSSLSTGVGLSPQYSYEGDRNVLRLRLPVPTMNPVLKMALAILTGAAVGLVGMTLLPSDVLEIVTDVLFEPTSQAWVRLLTAISAPIIFLTVVTTLLNTRKITERGGNSLQIVVRYFGLSFSVVFIALLCSQLLFSIGLARFEVSLQFVDTAVSDILSIIPDNIIAPFEESSTQQLLLLAFGLGCVLIQLGSWVDDLKRIIRQANMVGLRIAEVVSGLVPFSTGLLICLEMWYGRIKILSELWRPMVIALVISTMTLLLLAVVEARRARVGVGLLLRKMWRPFAVALKTGSLDESYGEAQLSCTQLLGINRAFTKVALPQGLVLYMPVSAIGTIVFTMFAARTFEVQGSLYWYLSAVIMAVVVFVATPPVPGANLLAYVVLFRALGIPESALLDAMIFDIVFGIFAGAANQAMLQLEMISQAGHFGLLDHDKLASPME